jgi:digeranylgeranylglycerophospholipid reductase
LKNNWDLIIIGSGPSGLATALGAKLNGVEKVLVLEKNQGVGSRLIGQSIHYKPDLIKQIFQNSIPKRAFVSRINTFGRNYYSPSGKKRLHIEDNIKRVWIDFRLFLEELAVQVLKTGVKLRTSSEVINIEEKENGNQVIYVQDRNKELNFRLNSKLNVIATGSDGLKGSLLHTLNIPTPTPICPIIASHFTGEYNKKDMEFYFHSDIENGVAATIYIFPHHSNVAEFGVIVFTDASRQPLSNVWNIWQKALQNPKIKDIVDPLKIYNITTAAIPMGGPVSKLYSNNLFVVGEAAGHVTPTGGSGILSGLEMGYYLGEQLGLSRNNWCKTTFNTIESKLLTHPVHEKLVLMAKMILPYRKKIFLELGTWDRIDSEWEEISSLLSLAFGKKG